MFEDLTQYHTDAHSISYFASIMLHKQNQNTFQCTCAVDLLRACICFMLTKVYSKLGKNKFPMFYSKY